MTGPISGAFRSTYWYDVPADPGASQPRRHEDPAGVFEHRDQAPRDAGTPTQFDDAPDQLVLPGESWTGSDGHRSTNDHGDRTAPWGYRGSVDANLNAPGGSVDEKHGGDHSPATAAMSPAGGANHGGLRATGVSDGWANPLGLALGHLYRIVHDVHRQRLHANRPRIRGVRYSPPTTSLTAASPPPGTALSSLGDPGTENFAAAGPSHPRLRRVMRPAGQTDYIATDADPAGTVALNRTGLSGAEWMA